MSGESSNSRMGELRRLLQLLKPPPADPARQLERLKTVERDVMLPVKAVFIVMLAYYLYFSQWMISVASLREVALEFIQKFFLAYAAFNVVVAVLLLFLRRFSLNTVRWVLFASGMLDGLLLSALILLTGGFQSVLYWFFPALILRNALSLPLAAQQISLNFTLAGFYLLAGLLQVSLAEEEPTLAGGELLRLENLGLTNALPPLLDQRLRVALGLQELESPAEPFLLRLLILALMTFVCYGLQMLFEKQRLAEAEARLFTLRQEQLNSAGRLSAEIAHQIKNPLAIINNAAFNLQRLAAPLNETARGQVAIIREEVERADRIITELLGYAKLADGRVERLDVAEEMDRALEKVFPAGQYAVEIQRRYAAGLPPLMMQRGHLSEIFVNILQNAREAMRGAGRLRIEARADGEGNVEVVIEDDGPGIPPERREQVFEPYFTTKEKGTGLGLSIVRHSLDIYGGSARAESGLGMGARFVLSFPAKVMMKGEK